ncbi:MFS transporter [Lacipirellula sp.]|uniref:MFS transporter n=1 Tax=Lacipirellula sp. TaxID=2691419 RepID=UPI003D14C039
MTASNAEPSALASPSRSGLVAWTPFYYGWVNVFAAALMMLATLPGRTQGLGLITEPLLADLKLDRTTFAQINLWATLIGALFCLPVGRWLDRSGARLVLVVLVFGLGAVVLGISRVETTLMLFLLITATRAIGQSALSVASIALVGKWFQRRISIAMGVYALLVGFMFVVAFGLVGYAVQAQGWRTAWGEIGIVLLAGFAPAAWLLVRSTPESVGVKPDDANAVEATPMGLTLSESLRTPAFWVFALATSIYGLVYSGFGLFNQSIVEQLGFTAEDYHKTLIIATFVGLATQLVGGWLGWKWSLRGLMMLAMGLYGASLLWLPSVTGRSELFSNAVLMGAAGGMVTVVFFAIWPELFGRRHLGLIQGAAQLLTVLASAVGPLLFAECFARTASYNAMFYALAPAVLILGLAAWFVPRPSLAAAGT